MKLVVDSYLSPTATMSRLLTMSSSPLLGRALRRHSLGCPIRSNDPGRNVEIAPSGSIAPSTKMPPK